jgi:hypothetical protein
MKTETKLDHPRLRQAHDGLVEIPMNGLYERLFALLDKRYRQILSKHCIRAQGSQVSAFYESMPEWNEFLCNLEIKATEAKEEWRMCKGSPRHILWILRREPEIHFVSDPCYELGIRLGLLNTNHKLLKMDDETAMKILTLGLP